MNEPYAVKGTAHIEIEIESQQMAEVLCRALKPETFDVPSDRAVTSVSAKDTRLILNIQADDLTALRAATNSFLSWLSGSRKAVESVLGQKP